MLVLTRKVGEQLIIDGDIRVTVVSLGQGRVKIGIDAPEWVKVDRQEIHDRKHTEPSETPVAVTPSEQYPSIGQESTTTRTPSKVSLPEPSEGPPRLENRIRRLRRLPNKPR